MTARLSWSSLMVALVLALGMCQSPVETPTLTPTVVPTPTATPIPGENQEALVLRVIDGDTIAVDLDGKHYSVRYIGIDTPETHHPTDGADWWGFEATDANRSFVKEGDTVVLQRDLSETDIYGRLLRYVWVGDTLVNAELVRMGMARVLFYEPDVLYLSEVKAAEAEAQEAERGLYGPKPTPPAIKPLLYKGTAWTVATEGDVVALRYDPARGDPALTLPADLKVRVVDAFWVPETQEWWYWIGINGFNGWVTGESITRDAPAGEGEGLALVFDCYDWATLRQDAALRETPGAGGAVTVSLTKGSRVQLDRLSWESTTGVWWLYAESTLGEGWVELDLLERWVH